MGLGMLFRGVAALLSVALVLPRSCRADTYEIEVYKIEVSDPALDVGTVELLMPNAKGSSVCFAVNKPLSVYISGETWSKTFSVYVWVGSKYDSPSGSSSACPTVGPSRQDTCVEALRVGAESEWQEGVCSTQHDYAKVSYRWKWVAGKNPPPPRAYEIEVLSYTNNNPAVVGAFLGAAVGDMPASMQCAERLPLKLTGTTTEPTINAVVHGYEKALPSASCLYYGFRYQEVCPVTLPSAPEGVWQEGAQCGGMVFRWRWAAPTPSPYPPPMPCPSVLLIDETGTEIAVESEPVKGRTSFVSKTGVNLTQIPPLYGPGEAFFPSWVPAGTAFRLRCCGVNPCHFFLAVYHCPPCSRERNGGYPGILPVEGWDAGSCAPRFGEKAYGMVSHHIEAAPGDVINIPPSLKDAIPVVFFNVPHIPDPWCPRPKTQTPRLPVQVACMECAP